MKEGSQWSRHELLYDRVLDFPCRRLRLGKVLLVMNTRDFPLQNAEEDEFHLRSCAKSSWLSTKGQEANVNR